jgi:hypothetical protein
MCLQLPLFDIFQNRNTQIFNDYRDRTSFTFQSNNKSIWNKIVGKVSFDLEVLQNDK